MKILNTGKIDYEPIMLAVSLSILGGTLSMLP